jgi:hypothetical protein
MLCPYVWLPTLIIFCLVAPELLVVHIIFNNSLPVTEQERLLLCLIEPVTGSSPEQWRTEGGGLPDSEVLTKLSRIPSSMENTSVIT